jgi:membrane protease YdiL (CAAX protease family)
MNDDRFVWEDTKQLSVAWMLLATAIPSGIAFAAFHAVAPRLVAAGMPSLYAWYAVAIPALAGFVCAGLVLCAREARILGVPLAARLCMRRTSGKMWLAAIAVMVVAIALAFAVKPMLRPFMDIFGLRVPSYTPFFLNPDVVASPATADSLAPGVRFHGNYTLLGLQAVALVLIISAEEVYFRAWMLPKLARLGGASWIVNGVLFACYHSFQIWLFPQILIASLGMALMVRMTRSIWPSVAGHLVGDFLLGMLGATLLVLGPAA